MQFKTCLNKKRRTARNVEPHWNIHEITPLSVCWNVIFHHLSRIDVTKIQNPKSDPQIQNPTVSTLQTPYWSFEFGTIKQQTMRCCVLNQHKGGWGGRVVPFLRGPSIFWKSYWLKGIRDQLIYSIVVKRNCFNVMIESTPRKLKGKKRSGEHTIDQPIQEQPLT